METTTGEREGEVVDFLQSPLRSGEVIHQGGLFSSDLATQWCDELQKLDWFGAIQLRGEARFFLY